MTTNVYFELHIESYNDQGEKVRLKLDGMCDVYRASQYCEYFGLKFSLPTLYRMKVEKKYGLNLNATEQGFWRQGIRLGEFRHEPLLCVRRLPPIPPMKYN
jgi:hypothetical protein